MSNFPSEMRAYIVSNLFEHYDLAFDDGMSTCYVYCHRCDDIVADINYGAVSGLSDVELYETIISAHEEL